VALGRAVAGEAGRSRAGPDLKENGASLYGRDPTKGFADATTTLASARVPVAEAVAWPVAGDQAQRSGVCGRQDVRRPSAGCVEDAM